MSGSGQTHSYERIKADLLSEAQALGVHTKGAALDPVFELLINGFAREMESLYDRVDRALEHNRRALLRNYLDEPFLEPPAQTVVGLDLKRPAVIGPGMRMAWQRPGAGMTPEYAVLSEREMVPLARVAAFYVSGASVDRLSWDERLQMTSERQALAEPAPRPALILALETTEEEIDSRHLSLLIQPNETGIPGLFPGSDPRRAFTDYLRAGLWQQAGPDGAFGSAPVLAPALAGGDFLEHSGRFPTERSAFGRLQREHLDADAIHRFEPGTPLRSGPVPEALRGALEKHASWRELAQQDGLLWLRLQLPHAAADDPRALFSMIAPNARLAVGYRREPRDRFNYKKVDYNLRQEIFEFGLADRPAKYCATFGQWVIARLEDQAGNEYPYVYESLEGGRERWFTLEVGDEEATLVVHLPRRKLPEIGYFDVHAGHLLGQVANTTDLRALARVPANALDFPEVAEMRLLVPAKGGGDGHPGGIGAGGRGAGPDRFAAGGAPVLKRQYARAAVSLRTHDRLVTVPDLRSFLTSLDSRIQRVTTRPVGLQREGRTVPGIRLEAVFDPAAKLGAEEQAAVCRLATRKIEQLTPVGLHAEVHPAGGEGGGRSGE